MKGRSTPSRAARVSSDKTMTVPGRGQVRAYAKRLGWRRTIARALYVGSNQVLDLSILDCFRMRREDIIASLARNPRRYDCGFLSPAKAERLATQLDADVAAGLREAIRRGDEAYAILDRGRLASIGLYASADTPVLNDLLVRFEPPARYMYRGFTQDEYRGQRLHALGILRAAGELFDRGVPQLVTVVEHTNYPASISVHRMGWRPCGFLYRFGWGGRYRLGRSRTAAGMGMELRRRDPVDRV